VVVAISRELLTTSKAAWTPRYTLVAQGRSGIGLAVSATRAGRVAAYADVKTPPGLSCLTTGASKTLVATNRGITLAEYLTSIVGPIVTSDLKEEMGKMMDEPAPKKPKGGAK
jgi:hypothetical protein